MKKTIHLLACLLLSATALKAQWTQITNIPVPAYISQMVIDGNNLYATTENGVSKSADNGNTWHELDLDVPYSPIGASGNTVCVFSAYNYQFLYSTDGGATFHPSSTYFGFVSSILAQGNKVFVLSETGFYVSNDQGATFTNTNLVSSGYHSGEIVQTPVGKVLIFTSIDFSTFDSSSFIYLSTDDLNWTEISGSSGSNPLPTAQNSSRDIYFYSAAYLNGAILAGSYSDGQGALYKSTDLGANWSPVDNNLFGTMGFIEAFGDNRTYVTDSQYQLRSSTDGVNWALVSPQFETLFDGSGEKFVATTSYGGQIHLSTDSGASWTQINNPPGNDLVRDFLSTGNTTFVVTSWNGLFRGTGNNPDNLSWTKVLGTGVNNGSNTGGSIFKKDNILLAGMGYDFSYGGQQGIFRSTNNGNSWTQTYPGSGRCFFDDGGAIYAGVEVEGIFKSTDLGQTWAPVNNGLPDPSQLNPSGILRIGGKLLTSFFFGGIYASTNNGNSWTQVCSQDIVYCMVKSGSTIFAGVQEGLMKSIDQGQTWEFVQNDLLGTAVTALYVKSGNVLYIGTGSQGLFKSADGGETLEPQNEGCENKRYVSYIGRNGNNLFAGRNVDPGYYYYYYISAYFGRMLWHQNANNLNTPPVGDRLSDQPAELGLSIYPNPVQDVLQFSLNVDPLLLATVQVINCKGEIVKTVSGPIVRREIELQDLPNSLYFLKVTLANGQSLMQQFMVMRGK